MKLAKFGVDQPIAAIMFFLAIVLFGIVSFFQLPIDFMPKIERPSLSVITEWPGASAEDVETKVTKIVENALSITSNLEEVQSNTKESLSVVTCKFGYGVDLHEASNDIKDRLEFIKTQLPADAKIPMIFKFDTSMIPIVFFGITAKENFSRLNDILEDDVISSLKRLPGVGAVMVVGGLQKQIQIKLDREKLKSFDLSFQDVENVLKSQNLTLPAGNLTVGDREYLIRVPGEYEKINDISDVILKKKDHLVVKLSDVATIKEGFKELKRHVRTYGQTSMMMIVQKKSGANTVDVAKRVKAEVENIQKQKKVPMDVSFKLMMDSSEFIERAIQNLWQTALWGIIFVALTTFYFYRSLRMSSILLITIPISLVMAFCFMQIMGWSLNVISLAALAIAIGMVVDNAVVVLDNIMAHHQRGESVRKSALLGTNEVGLAISASTFTTIVVFLPLLFISGIVGVLFKQLGVVVTVTLLGSLVSALILTPLFCHRFLQKEEKQTFLKRWADRFYHATYQRLERGFSKILEKALKNRKKTVALSVLLFLSSLLLIPLIKTEFMPKEDSGDIQITFELPLGTAVEKTAKICQEVEILIREIGGSSIKHVFWRCGSVDDARGAVFAGKEGSNIGIMGVKLVKKAERKMSSEEFVQKISPKMESYLDIVKLNLDAGDPFSKVMYGAGKPISIEIIGHDLKKTLEIAKEIKEISQKVPGAKDVSISFEAGKPELLVKIDRKKAASLGLDMASIATTLRSLYYGKKATGFHQKAHDYDIFMQLENDQRKSVDDILRSEIVSRTKTSIPLQTIASIEEKSGPLEIERKHQERMIKVEMNALGRSQSDMISEIKSGIEKKIVTPQGVSIVYAGTMQEQKSAFTYLLFMLILGLILVYMVMAAQFGSLKEPFIIMFSIPFAFTGVFIFLAITHTSLSVLSFIGMVMLIGIVVNNAIVLVDYANILCKRGEAVDEALFHAGKQRLRPVLVTTLTTVFGMIPLVMSHSEGSEMWKPLAITVIGGLSVSTLVTLVFIPVLYSLFEKNKKAREKVSEEVLKQASEDF